MKITLEFDDPKAADLFLRWWLDGGGEQESGFYTVVWDRDYIRVKLDEEEKEDL